MNQESPIDARRSLNLRVLSYNIHGCVDSRRTLNVINIIDVILKLNADLIALQEVDVEKPLRPNRNQAATIGHQLGLDNCYIPPEKTGRRAFGLAVLSRYPIVQKDFMVLPNLYPMLNMRKRGAMHLILETPLGPLHLINTHLRVHKLERFGQLSSLLRWNQLLNQPMIVCGDFTARPTSLIYRKLSKYLNDVQKAVIPAQRASANISVQSTHAPHRPYLRFESLPDAACASHQGCPDRNGVGSSATSR